MYKTKEFIVLVQLSNMVYYLLCITSTDYLDINFVFVTDDILYLLNQKLFTNITS